MSEEHANASDMMTAAAHEKKNKHDDDDDDDDGIVSLEKMVLTWFLHKIDFVSIDSNLFAFVRIINVTRLTTSPWPCRSNHMDGGSMGEPQ
jgi:hypothetical protein